MRLTVLALLVLLLPSEAFCADAEYVLDCIKRVKSASWASSSVREVLAAFVCQGAGASDGDEADFDLEVGVIRECFNKITFWSKSTGIQAEIIAATACVGCVDADETLACVEKVQRTLRTATGATAESIAAQACARGNQADETAKCVGEVSFRLEVGGVTAEQLAAIACETPVRNGGRHRLVAP